MSRESSTRISLWRHDARARRYIESGRFADEWDKERDAGYPELEQLRSQHVYPILEFEAELRSQLGETAAR